MEPSCLRHTEFPHTSRLFSDFLCHFERVRQWYGHDPHDRASFRKAAGEIRFPEERRAALVAALRAQNPGHPALETLARPGTVAVVTGQQAGLLSGPAYTFYKALTAARLASRLTEDGIPSVAVFWLATEDHDLAEINHCWVFNSDAEPVRIEAPGESDAPRPVGGIPVPAGVVDALRTALAGRPFAAEIVALASEAYGPGATYGSGFRKLLSSLLSRFGLLMLDPLDPAIRQLAAPALAEAVRGTPELVANLKTRSQELEASGYHAQVRVEDVSAPFFLLDGGRRLPVRRAGDGFSVNGGRIPAGELATRAQELSPNALLRPVVQDFILPTVAYIGGPAELAYLAQAETLYRALLGRMPVALHRASLTLVDSRSARLMDRYGLSLPDFFAGEDAVRERIASRLVPPDLRARIGQIREETGATLDEFRDALLAFDPTLAASLEKSRRKIFYQLDKTVAKAARERLRRDERASREAAALSHLLYPHKHPQERFYSLLPFLAWYGTDLLDRLYAELPIDCAGHRVLPL